MKLLSTFPIVIAATLIAFATGCDKKDQSTSATDTGMMTNEVQTRMDVATNEMRQTANSIAAGTEETRQNIITAVTSTVQNATSAVAANFDTMATSAQGLIEKAKSLINDKRYDEALASLKQLSNFSLTPEQQKTVNDLKTQLQKIMSSEVMTNAASALDNLIKK